MGEIYSQNINSFNGGISNDIRSKDLRYFSFASHLDSFSYPHKLVPRFGDDTKEAGSYFETLTTKPFRFLYANGLTGANAGTYLFGLGKSSSKPAILYWDSDANQWDFPNAGIGGSGTEVDNDVFFEYKGYAYMWNAGVLMRYKLDSTEAFNDTYQTVTGGATVVRHSQPVHFSIDDIAYFFSDNFVHSLNDTTWDDKVLTLPSDCYIVGAVEYGTYLVIAVNYISSTKTSLFFWGRDSSLTTVISRYDIENEETYKIGVISGRIMLVTSGAYKINVRRYNGAEFEKIKEISSGDEKISVAVSDTQQEAIVFEDKMFFPMTYTSPDASSRLAIWALDVNGRLVADTLVNGATSYQGIFFLSGLLWIAHSDLHIVRTNRTFSTTPTTVYESLMLGEVSENKKLIKVGISTEALPSSGQIVLKYRISETGSWTTIFTHTTDGSYYHDAINIESTGVTLPEYREIQFRIESIGGAVILGLDLKYEIKDDNLA